MNRKATILIVEDDFNTAIGIQRFLEYNGYHVQISSNGEKAITMMNQYHFDLVILDIRLPDSNGIDLLRWMRASKNYAKVILLSARREKEMKLLGLRSGANDYITKPFDPDELLCRIEVQLRKSYDNEWIQCGNTNLAIKESCIYVNSNRQDLTQSETLLLGLLMEDISRTVTRHELNSRIDVHGVGLSERTLDVYISRIRKKLDIINSNIKICSRKGIGYQVEIN